MPEFSTYSDPRGSSSLLRRTTIYASKYTQWHLKGKTSGLPRDYPARGAG